MVDFNAAGEIVTDSLTANSTLNGAYAATTTNVAAAWGVTESALATTAFANGTKGAAVASITNAVQSVINAKDSTIFGSQMSISKASDPSCAARRPILET